MRRDFRPRTARRALSSSAVPSRRTAILDSASRTPRYRIALLHAKGGYVAAVRNLPGCSARGSTEVEAVERARAAIRLHLALVASVEDGAAIVELEIAP